MDSQDKNFQELLAKLDAIGVDTGKWKQQEARTTQPKFAKTLRPLVGELRSLIQEQLNQNILKVNQLRELKHRLTHGGGK